jgi:hypothetical protein
LVRRTVFVTEKLTENVTALYVSYALPAHPSYKGMLEGGWGFVKAHKIKRNFRVGAKEKDWAMIPYCLTKLLFKDP